MSVSLRPLRDDEFEAWLPLMRSGYADSMVTHAGMAPEAARAKAAVDAEQLFPGGRQSSDQAVFAIEAGGERVGNLWVSERDSEHGRILWIFDVDVDEGFRGRGYGRAAMLFAEEEARRRGLGGVALNVFGGNEVARSLYRSLGYAERAVFMHKAVEAGS
jgi:ribosomal protein S18 acetylase RimI-like enzyme